MATQRKRGELDFPTPTPETSMAEMRKCMQESMADMRRSMSHMRGEVERCAKESCKLIREIHTILASYSDFFKEHQRLISNADETLGSVLLAIRQNEYLQAYYPEQNGFKAGKFIGQHTSKITGSTPRNQGAASAQET